MSTGCGRQIFSIATHPILSRLMEVKDGLCRNIPQFSVGITAIELTDETNLADS